VVGLGVAAGPGRLHGVPAGRGDGGRGRRGRSTGGLVTGDGAPQPGPLTPGTVAGLACPRGSEDRRAARGP
jgi:hypothetical protein